MLPPPSVRTRLCLDLHSLMECRKSHSQCKFSAMFWGGKTYILHFVCKHKKISQDTGNDRMLLNASNDNGVSF